jgi:hypothetical protein
MVAAALGAHVSPSGLLRVYRQFTGACRYGCRSQSRCQGWTKRPPNSFFRLRPSGRMMLTTPLLSACRSGMKAMKRPSGDQTGLPPSRISVHSPVPLLFNKAIECLLLYAP